MRKITRMVTFSFVSTVREEHEGTVEFYKTPDPGIVGADQTSCFCFFEQMSEMMTSKFLEALSINLRCRSGIYLNMLGSMLFYRHRFLISVFFYL